MPCQSENELIIYIRIWFQNRRAREKREHRTTSSINSTMVGSSKSPDISTEHFDNDQMNNSTIKDDDQHSDHMFRL
ncbi:hypothetical protein BLOT_004791 [Blomia tropicalis]|nr:hypothetical protein BLOT_004791 [Blomia tropicalis]